MPGNPVQEQAAAGGLDNGTLPQSDAIYLTAVCAWARGAIQHDHHACVLQTSA
jgi:hypothetical protein